MEGKSYKKPGLWVGAVIIIVLVAAAICFGVSSRRVTLPEEAYALEGDMPYLYIYNVKTPKELLALPVGTYSKNFEENGILMGVESCALGAIDERASHPKVEPVEGQSFQIICGFPADSFTLREYDMQSAGSSGEAVEYEYGDAVIFREGCIYEIHMIWDAEHLEENGFYGDGYYYISTL